MLGSKNNVFSKKAQWECLILLLPEDIYLDDFSCSVGCREKHNIYTRYVVCSSGNISFHHTISEIALSHDMKCAKEKNRQAKSFWPIESID